MPDWYWMILFFIYLCSNYLLIKELFLIFYSSFLKCSKRFLFYRNDRLFQRIYILTIISHVLYLWYFFKNYELRLYVLAFCIVLLYQFIYKYKLSDSEIESIIRNSCLSLDYGSALSYYENYLKIVFQETISQNDFKTRINMYESNEGVEIIDKLFILAPYSCKIETYINEKESNISRAGELPPFERDVAGIPDRTYNTTVYHIISKECTYYVRCAIEYAMPLKALLDMKEENLISSDDLYEARNVCCKTLIKMLNQNSRCKEFIEIIEYDDRDPNYELYNVLLEHKSIHPFCKPYHQENI